MCIPLIVAGQRLGKYVPAAANTHNNRRIVGDVVFYAACVVSKESGGLTLPRTSCYNSDFRKSFAFYQNVLWTAMPLFSRLF
jgi:hypothetical protein